MKRKTGILAFLVSIIVFSVFVSSVVAPADPYTMNGYIKSKAGEGLVGANITFTNTNTTEQIYFDSSTNGSYSQNALNFPSEYSDGDNITYYVTYNGTTYLNESYYHVINVTADGGGNTVNIILDQAPTLSTSPTDLGLHLVDHTPTVTWTEGTDADTGDTVTTYIYVGTGASPTTEEGNIIGSTIDLGSTVTLTDGTTYYYRLRSYDGERWSNYTADDEFRMNSKPTVNSVVISPGTTNTTTDLTGSGTYNDTEGDTESGTTYKWFKDDTEISGEIGTALVATNFVKGNQIIFQYTPNDSYEAGTSVNSSVITIGNTALSLNSIGAKTVDDKQQLSIDANGTDQDVSDGVDTFTFSCNRTDLFSDFNTSTGISTWTPFYNQTGTYYVDFGVSDGAAYDNETVTIIVNDVTFDTTLFGGYNLLGWIAETDGSAGEFAGLVHGATYIIQKNETTGDYDSFSPSVPELNNFTTSKGKGYFVYTNATTPFARSRIDAVMYDTTLPGGYSIFGWTNINTQNASSIVSDIGGNCTYLVQKNTTTGNYETFDPSVPEINSFDASIGHGYYAYVTSETVWARDE